MMFPAFRLTEENGPMWQYYAFMALLITTLALWAIIALRDDGYDEDEADKPASQEPEDKTS
jgi:hypothetical protein